MTRMFAVQMCRKHRLFLFQLLLPFFAYLHLFISSGRAAPTHYYDNKISRPSNVVPRGIPISSEANRLCSSFPGLSREQYNICLKQPDATREAMEGLNLGIRLCQAALEIHRWNCSALARNITNPSRHHVIDTGYKEASVARAMLSAGIAYKVAEQCSKSTIETCTCGKKSVTNGSFELDGCSDNLAYGEWFARIFMDNNERGDSLQSLVNLHNNKAGRLMFRNSMVKKTSSGSKGKKCRCHGMSGSCAYKICWQAVPSEKQLIRFVRNKFRKAAMVTLRNSNREGQKLALVGSMKRKKIRKTDLVYFEKSPNFCAAHPKSGHLGVAGRRCNRTSNGRDGCASMCCGKGYDTVLSKWTEQCNCKFVWCCNVTCETCAREEWVTFCKAT